MLGDMQPMFTWQEMVADPDGCIAELERQEHDIRQALRKVQAQLAEARKNPADVTRDSGTA